MGSEVSNASNAAESSKRSDSGATVEGLDHQAEHYELRFIHDG